LFVNFKSPYEILPADYRKPESRGLHWITAAARSVRELQLVMKSDSSGFGGAPFEEGMHDIAAEWFDRLYVTGLARLRGGATLHQLHLSQVACSNLTGAQGTPADPVFLATIFAQIFQAGAVAAQTRPFEAQNTASLGSHGVASQPPVAVIPPATLAKIRDTAVRLAPLGTPIDAIEDAIHATATFPEGTTFREKFKGKVKSLGGRMREETVKEVAESQYLMTSGKRSAKSWILQSQANLRKCYVTQGNARFLNCSSKGATQATFRLIIRNFTDEQYGLQIFVPRVPGFPTPAKLKISFGEAANGLIGSSLDSASTAAQERGECWLHLRMALQTVHVLDIASFDFGFTKVVVFYIDNLSTFESNAVPFGIVCRELGKFFADVQSQRETELTRVGHSDESEPSLTLSYVEPPDLEASRKALFQWNRETRSIRNVEFMRSLEDALQSGALQNFPGLALAATKGTNGGQSSSSQSRRQNDRKSTSKSSARTSGGQQSSTRPGVRAQSAKTSHTASKPNNPYSMDRTKWGVKYGAANTLCWWHSNSPKGCQRSPCSLKHQFPPKYSGKAFSALSTSEQAAICAACAK
jgi:hypothetical protein